jgi:hypothetical protein
MSSVAKRAKLILMGLNAICVKCGVAARRRIAFTTTVALLVVGMRHRVLHLLGTLFSLATFRLVALEVCRPLDPVASARVKSPAISRKIAPNFALMLSTAPPLGSVPVHGRKVKDVRKKCLKMGGDGRRWGYLFEKCFVECCN